MFGEEFVLLERPTKIIFGFDRIQRIGSELINYNLKNALVVTDQGLIKSGLIDKIKEILDESTIQSEIFREVLPNSGDTIIDRGATLGNSKEFDFVYWYRWR